LAISAEISVPYWPAPNFGSWSSPSLAFGKSFSIDQLKSFFESWPQA
jgi:hypothetical protein